MTKKLLIICVIIFVMLFAACSKNESEYNGLPKNTGVDLEDNLVNSNENAIKSAINSDENIIENIETDYDDKIMPVGMWVSPPLGEITNERYKEIEEAGINFVIGFNEFRNGQQGIKAALDAAAANNLKFIVRDTRVNGVEEEDIDSLEDVFTLYKDHPAYMGHIAVDEPCATAFDLLGKMSEKYNEVMPDGLFYVNMLPTYSSIDQRGIADYEEFVQTYIDKVKPKVLSYDHYPLLTITENSIEEFTWDYFNNLDIIRKIANKNDIPYYVFIQTMWYGNDRRDPNEDEIRWQVNMSLTYGAKGIQYFTYWTPKADGYTVFGDAMIDLEGNKTQHYYDVQKVNAELKWIDDVLLTSECIGVIAHAKKEPYRENPLTEFDPLLSLEGDEVMVGCFIDNEGNKKLLITNMSYSKNTKIEIELDVSLIEKISIIKKGVRTTYSTKDSNGKLILEIDKSEAVLVEIH